MGAFLTGAIGLVEVLSEDSSKLLGSISLESLGTMSCLPRAMLKTRSPLNTHSLMSSFLLKEGDSIYIPGGFAHGYQSLNKENIILYFLSKTYNSKKKKGIKWNDKILNIPWKIKRPIISRNDKNLPSITTIKNEKNLNIWR